MTITQEQNRGEMRRMIGRNLNCAIISAATSTSDTSSLIDTKELAWFSDDELIGRQVIIYDATGSIVDGESSFVSDNAKTGGDATCSPVFSSAVTSGDKYEMWHVYRTEEVNDVINQAIMEVSRKCLQKKQTSSTFTERDLTEYNCLSGFVGIHTVEYGRNIGESEIIDDCSSAWTGGTGTTVSLDSEIQRYGTSCNKLDVSDSVAAAALLAYKSISSTDFSNYDTIEFWIRSTIDLTAGQLEFYLDDTAACASATDTVSLPAISKDTWTMVQLTMTNPELDTAIISIGLGQASGEDVGACTIWLNLIMALKDKSRDFMELNPQLWEITKGTTNYLKLTARGRAVVGNNVCLRLSGYALPSLLSNDTTDSEVDPPYIINYATAYMMFYHAKASRLDVANKEDRAKALMAKVERQKIGITTSITEDTKWVE